MSPRQIHSDSSLARADIDGMATARNAGHSWMVAIWLSRPTFERRDGLVRNRRRYRGSERSPRTTQTRSSEPGLATWSGVFARHLADGRGAMALRAQAAAARRERGKTRTWPDGFFRRGRATKRRDGPPREDGG